MRAGAKLGVMYGDGQKNWYFSAESDLFNRIPDTLIRKVQILTHTLVKKHPIGMLKSSWSK